MSMKKEFTSRGFTLIETMIAVTILTLAVVGPLFTANRAIIAAEIARDQLIASYLSQEGIEYIRMVRDNSYLSAYQTNPETASSVAWTSFLNTITAECGTSCQFDPANNYLNACSGSSCTPLYLATTKMYTQQSSSGTITPFTRTIQVTGITASDEKVISKVSWSFHNVTYSVTITDHLTSWQ